LVTEFFAGFSDVFGGRSRAIRNRLGEIQREAIAELRAKAASSGENWIVGLRVDMDEVSGKSTMMFMVTATGTAVLAERAPGAEEVVVRSALSAEEVELEQERRRLASITDLEPWFTGNRLGGLVEKRIPSLAPVFLNWAREQDTEEDREINSKRLEWAVAYFATLDAGDATEVLYANAVIPPIPAPMCETEIMVRLRILDFDKTLDLLKSGDARRRWWGLQTLSAKKAFYRRDDLDAVDRIVAAIERMPSDAAAEVEVKLLLGKKQVWVCLQGHENALSGTRCRCGLDRHGFMPKDMTAERALAELGQLREILKSLLPL
jgi:uncharacterized protein YbjQ (UPF0145 family)